MIRKTAVAGYFYPDKEKELISFIENNEYKGEKLKSMLSLVPHAGYIYSGGVAVKTISKSLLSDTVIILGVNHTGFGEPLSVWDKDYWETPLGSVPIDEDLAAEVIKTTSAKSDIIAHVREHSIETAVPILKYFNSGIKIVPIVVMGMNMSRLRSFACDLAKIISYRGCSIVISSDMNHYENEEVTNEKDMLAIKKILSVDGLGLYDTVMEKSVSMCGVYPCTAGLIAVSQAGAKKGELVEHTTSGRVSGDYNKVVGYAGIIIS